MNFLDSITQLTTPRMQEAMAQALDAAARAKGGDPGAAQEIQSYMAMYQVWFQLNVEMTTLVKTLSMSTLRGINA